MKIKGFGVNYQPYKWVIIKTNKEKPQTNKQKNNTHTPPPSTTTIKTPQRSSTAKAYSKGSGYLKTMDSGIWKMEGSETKMP